MEKEIKTKKKRKNDFDDLVSILADAVDNARDRIDNVHTSIYSTNAAETNADEKENEKKTKSHEVKLPDCEIMNMKTDTISNPINRNEYYKTACESEVIHNPNSENELELVEIELDKFDSPEKPNLKGSIPELAPRPVELEKEKSELENKNSELVIEKIELENKKSELGKEKSELENKKNALPPSLCSDELERSRKLFLNFALFQAGLGGIRKLQGCTPGAVRILEALYGRAESLGTTAFYCSFKSFARENGLESEAAFRALRFLEKQETFLKSIKTIRGSGTFFSLNPAFFSRNNPENAFSLNSETTIQPNLPGGIEERYDYGMILKRSDTGFLLVFLLSALRLGDEFTAKAGDSLFHLFSRLRTTLNLPLSGTALEKETACVVDTILQSLLVPGIKNKSKWITAILKKESPQELSGRISESETSPNRKRTETAYKILFDNFITDASTAELNDLTLVKENRRDTIYRITSIISKITNYK